MVKFAVALCMLLVASGAQGNWLDSAEELLQQAVDKLEEQWAKVSEIRQDFLEESRRKAEEARRKIAEKFEEVSTNAQNKAKCISENGDFADRLEEIAAVVDDCAYQAQIVVEENYRQLQDEVDAFKSALNEVKADFSECRSRKNALACAWELKGELAEKVAAQWQYLWPKIQAFTSTAWNYQGTLRECASTDGYESFQENKEEVDEKVERCMAALEEE